MSTPPQIESDDSHHQSPSTPEAEHESSRARQPLAFVLSLLGVITVAGWLMLHQWYGLLARRDHVHFSFEKIEGGFDSPIMRQTLLIFIVLSVCFLASVVLFRRLPGISRWTLMAISCIAIAAGIINVLIYPVGALDVFNYMVELKLAYHFGDNPYIETLEQYRPDPYAHRAFLVDITLFYGPAWLAMMWVPVAFDSFSNVIDTLIALKAYNAMLIAITAGIIGWFHRHSPLVLGSVALFLLNPLVLFEGVANAHNDVVLTLFIVGAMVAMERRSPLAGPLLALSALVKLYTVALAPIFIAVALRERWGWRRIMLTMALSVIAMAGTAAPWWGNGEMLDGLQAGLEESQEMDHVSPLSLARQFAQEQVAQDAYNTTFIRSRPSFEIVPQDTQDAISNGFTIAFVALALIIAWTVWKGRPAPLGVAETLLLLYLLMTNLYPWYLIAVVAVLALHPDRLSRWYIFIASALGLIYYPMFIHAHFNTEWTRFQVHQFLALFLVVPMLVYLITRLGTSLRGTRSTDEQASLRCQEEPIHGKNI